MHSSPLVSVIIPSYNNANFINRTVLSVLEQAYSNIELLVIDDGSTDNTKQILEPYFDRIRYFFQNNKGLASARNTGLRNARGEFIAFLDSDDYWLPNKLSLQTELIRSSGQIGIVGCGGYLLDQDKNTKEHFFPPRIKTKKIFFELLCKKNVVSGSGSGVLVKRECFEKVGYFDESLKSAEDWDMWLRISSYYEVKFIDKPLVNIRIRQNSMSGTTNAAIMLENELRVLGKLFSSKDIKFKWYLKNRSYCYRYFCAAWAFWDAGKKLEAKKYILKSLFTNPFYFITNKDCLALLAKIFLINIKEVLE